MKTEIVVIDGVNTVRFATEESDKVLTPVPLTITPVPLTKKGKGAKS